MADDAGHPGADLMAAPETTPDTEALIAEMDFFRMLALLERDGHRFGRSGGPDREPARLGQSVRLAFATQDVAQLNKRPGSEVPEVAVNVLGLLGPEGPMPLHITRWVMERMSNRWFAGDNASALADTSFLDFVNMLQHRMLALYWRAWAEARPEIQLAHDDGGRVSAMLRAFAGLGMPGSATSDGRIDDAKLHHATNLVQDRNDPERLVSFLSTVIDAPVTLQEFVGHWMELPERLQTRLGVQHCGLGTGAVAGARSFDRQSRAELQVGPLSVEKFRAFLSDSALWDRLRHAIIAAAGKELEFDLRLILRASDVPAARIGEAVLGRTAWVNPPGDKDADDLKVARVSREEAGVPVATVAA